MHHWIIASWNIPVFFRVYWLFYGRLHLPLYPYGRGDSHGNEKQEEQTQGRLNMQYYYKVTRTHPLIPHIFSSVCRFLGLQIQPWTDWTGSLLLWISHLDGEEGWNERTSRPVTIPPTLPPLFWWTMESIREENLEEMQNANINHRTNMSVRSWLHGH